MGTNAYASFTIDPDDTVEERQKKLYMAVCSMGDWLYRQGAAINEMNKEYLRWEKELNSFRQELKSIRELLNVKE